MSARNRFAPEVLDLIGGIYDSVLSTETWPDILQRLGDVAGLRAVNLFAADLSNREVNVTAASRWVPLEVLQEYGAEYVQYDSAGLKRLSTWTPGVLVPISELAPVPEPIREWLERRLGIRGRFGARLNDQVAWVDGMNFHLDQSAEVLSAGQRYVLEATLPHLAKAVAIGRPFQLLRARFQAVLAALDRLHMGVMILNSRGQVIISNREAARIVSLRDGLSIDHLGRPMVAAPVPDGGLDTLIAEVVATAQGLASSAEKQVVIPRPSMSDPFIAEISPLTGSGGELPQVFRGALLLIVDPMRSDLVSPAGMEALYGLTPAEAAVLGLVIDGRSTQEIADARDTSPDTVRAQIKAVFAKTRTQTRAALVRLALTVNLPVDPAPRGGPA